MVDRSTAILAFVGGLIAALLIVLIVVLLDGNGDDGIAVTSSSTTITASTTAAPSTTAGSTTTVAAATTTVPSTTPTTTTTVGLGACASYASSPLPPGATDVTSAVGDVDGDGTPDQVVVYRDGATWWVHVDLGIGFSIEASFSPYDPGTSPGMYDVIDVGVAEEMILVNTGFALPGPVYGVWFVQDCQVFQATLDGGDLLLYASSGIAHGESFACSANGLTFVEAYQPGGDPNVWEVRQTPYYWVPGLGDFQSQPPTTYATDQNSALAAVAGIGC